MLKTNSLNVEPRTFPGLKSKSGNPITKPPKRSLRSSKSPRSWRKDICDCCPSPARIVLFATSPTISSRTSPYWNLEGELEGFVLGDAIGPALGKLEGDPNGVAEGPPEGRNDGLLVGPDDGFALDDADGPVLGELEGFASGDTLGPTPSFVIGGHVEPIFCIIIFLLSST